MMGSLIWIHGKPSSAKTVLCSAIIEALLHHCLPLHNSVVAYFYCDFRDSTKQDVDGILSRLLVDISAELSACTNILRKLYSNHSNGLRRPSNDELKNCLEDMLRASTGRSIYIVIDALDECPDSGIMSPRNRVLMLIQDLLALCLSNLPICVTSRPETSVTTVLSRLNAESIAVEDGMGQARDMADYVQASVDRDAGLAYGTNVIKLSWSRRFPRKRTACMFRWVSCQLNALRYCPPGLINSTLESLPETLDETYDRILRGINKGAAQHLHRIFKCLVVSARPLLLEELVELLAVDIDGDIPKFEAKWRCNNSEVTILGLCSALVVMHPATKRVQFTHFSVQEYLLSDYLVHNPDVSLKRFCVVKQDAHAVVAMACLGVLLRLPAWAIGTNTRELHPLSIYSANHWVKHASFDGVPIIIQKALEHFFDPSDRFFISWIQIYNIDSVRTRHREYDILCRPGRCWKSPHGLYCASLCGFEHVVRHILDLTSSNCDEPGGCRGTALGAACYKGYLNIARLLIEHGADVNAIVDKTHETVLEVALKGKHVEIARLPVEHGADVNAPVGKYGTALARASSRGQIEIARLLIEHSADVNVPAGEYGTALEAALKGEHVKIARLLIERGANASGLPGEHLPLVDESK